DTRLCVHPPLCALHRMERELRMGRSLCFHCCGDGRVHFSSTIAEVSSRTWKGNLELRSTFDRREPCYSARISRVLGSAGDLSDRRPRFPVRNLAKVQEHCCVRIREDGSVGAEHRCGNLRSMGLSAHHLLEFSALCFATGRGSPEVGGGYGVWRLGSRNRRSRILNGEIGR